MHRGKKVAVIIPAAGESLRFGGPIRKQFADLCGKPVWLHAVETFHRCGDVDWIVVVGHGDALNSMRKQAEALDLQKIHSIVEGGPHRQDSVYLGLQQVRPLDPDIILVHDAVRPLVSLALIAGVVEAACLYGAAVPAVRPKETIKLADADSFVAETLRRDALRVVQTPQGFQASILYEAFDRAQAQKVLATDEASLVERIDRKVKLVEGEYRNVKITTPEDLRVVEATLAHG